MKKRVTLLLVAAGLLAFGAGCAKEKNENANTTNNESAVLNDELNLNDTLDLNTSVEEEDLDVNSENEDLTQDDTDTEVTNANQNTNTTRNTNTANTNSAKTTSDTITITSPETDEELVSPFYVEGKATSGDAVYVRLKSGGSTIFTEKVSIRSGAYRGKLLFDFTHTTSGTIEVFQQDANGGETGLASIAVKFKLSTTNTNATVNGNANASNTNI